MHRIVIAGAGFGGVSTYKALHKRIHGRSDIALTIVNDTTYFLFTPLLHEVATGSVQGEHIVEPIEQVLRCCVQKHVIASVKKVHTNKNILETSAGDIPYDYLVLALGSETAFFGIPGAKQHSFTLKTLDDAVTLRSHLLRMADVEQHTIAIIGGGPTGVELAAGATELYHSVHAKAKIMLIQREAELLPMFAPPIRKISLEALQKKGVHVLLNTVAEKVESNRIHLSTGEIIKHCTPIWVAGVMPRQVEFDVAVEADAAYKLHVDGTLQLTRHPTIFVIGDMARCEQEKEPLPALAQVADQEGRIVARNIMALLQGKKEEHMHYHHRGSLVSLGQWMAAGHIGRWKFSGHIAWFLWRTVYLTKILTWKKRMAVAKDWLVHP